jgi:hypothetical protein
MTRPAAFFATILLAGTCLSGSAEAGWFDFSHKASDKAAAATPSAAQTAAEAAKTAPGNLDNDIRQAQLMRASGDFNGAVRSLAQMMLVYPDDARVVGEYGKVLTRTR